MPPPNARALPSSLDGCLRNEVNTLTIAEKDGIVYLDQSYQCEINELSEADQILKERMGSINTKEIHFSMEIQIIPIQFSGSRPLRRK